jgi:hypothetical protein
VACCGVSRPAFVTAEGRKVPEQFTPAGLAALTRQADREIPLSWGHGGPTLCTTRGLDLSLFTRALLGLCFQARLPDTASNRSILAQIGDELVGVSVAFVGAKGWLVERDGIGTIRIVDAAQIDHIALIPPGSGQRAAYPAAWAAASSGHRGLCPSAVKVRAEQAAYGALKVQAGCRC